jgi:hypothetical protein
MSVPGRLIISVIGTWIQAGPAYLAIASGRPLDAGIIGFYEHSADSVVCAASGVFVERWDSAGQSSSNPSWLCKPSRWPFLIYKSTANVAHVLLALSWLCWLW